MEQHGTRTWVHLLVETAIPEDITADSLIELNTIIEVGTLVGRVVGITLDESA